jgi:hypothetical protein
MNRAGTLGLIAVGVIALAVYLFGFRWQSQRVIERRQHSFHEAICHSEWRKARRLLADDYGDAWGFSADEAVEAMGDARAFISFPRIEALHQQITVSGGKGVYRARLRIHGDAAFGGGLQTRINRLRAPFSFTWRKTGAWPWAWQISRIENPELELPEDYVPGSIRRVRQSLDAF